MIISLHLLRILSIPLSLILRVCRSPQLPVLALFIFVRLIPLSLILRVCRYPLPSFRSFLLPVNCVVLSSSQFRTFATLWTQAARRFLISVKILCGRRELPATLGALPPGNIAHSTPSSQQRA